MTGGTKPPTTPAQIIHSEPNSSHGLILKSYKYQESHPINNILTNLTFRITTRLRLQNLCAFKAFLLIIKPKKVNEELLDIDWIIAMQKELHQFERRKVVTSTTLLR